MIQEAEAKAKLEAQYRIDIERQLREQAEEKVENDFVRRVALIGSPLVLLAVLVEEQFIIEPFRLRAATPQSSASRKASSAIDNGSSTSTK